MPDEILLNEAADKVWQTVRDAGLNGVEVSELANRADVHQSQVMATAIEAEGQGFFTVTERVREQIVQSDQFLSLFNRFALPEQKAIRFLINQNDEMPQAKFIEWAKVSDVPVNEIFKWGPARGWIERDKGPEGPIVRITPSGKKAAASLHTEDDLVAVLRATQASPKPYYLDECGDEQEQAIIRSRLANRPEIAKIKKRTVRVVAITRKGVDAHKMRCVVKERNALTPADLESGAWKDPNFKLRPFDITLPAREIYPAKIHPLRKIIEQTRRAFLEMGFAEVVSPMIESAFWNFDALFQPQDHPAREMQDTFYMRHPATTSLPEKGVRTILHHAGPPTGAESSSQNSSDPFFNNIVDNVRRTHEDGWETGSEGWGYKWSPDRSRQVVLRTHTTAATIRALAANPNPPGKFFCVGWTYRNETISFKHLPVFHQVDGIIIDEEANLASLMGTLQEFYSKMGFGRVKFKPAFYPYTEPSVDVVVYMESRGKWLEMGGAGIFRPEVTLPLGCKYPVLAWGLGIERLAMLRFGLSDIRELYGTNLNDLEKVPLCQ